jgi:hypothetical protein
MPPPTKPTPAIKVPYKTLVGLLGKSPKDPVVVAAMAKAGSVSFQSSFIIAKEAGFDFALGRPEGAKRNAPKVLTSLFLFADGADKHRGYADLPSGFAFVPRADLLATLPAPAISWKMGKGKVPASTPGVSHDTWIVDGFEVCAMYGNDGSVRHINVSLPDDATGGRSLSTHPLHFETKPVDAPPDADLVGMALLVAWGADRFGLPAKHASSELGKQLVKRAITPRTFLVNACGKTLTTLDFAPELGEFLYEYQNKLIDDDGARDKADKAIAKLLHFDRPDRRHYTDDFLGTFAKAVDSPFHVPDSWAAVDRIAPVIDARLADFKATHFESAPDLALYETAAKLRDKVSVVADRTGVAATSADDALADDLVALIGMALKDAHVKAVLTRAGMPIGKKIDQQANPALGVAYMGAKFDIAGTKQLGVDAVWFYAAKQESYIRGMGTKVQFQGYPGKLPRGLALGMARADVAKLLGKPKTTYEDTDYWYPTKQLQLNCEFKRGKLVELYIGQNKDY